MLEKLTKEKSLLAKKEDTSKKKKLWKWPTKWKGAFRKSTKQDTVLVMYLNIKGEIEQPMLLPLYTGNMVIVRNKPYEVDPRAFWTVKMGAKMFKVLILKEIDRRPVSNLNYSEIRERGDATDSDEFLIKAALKAQSQTVAKPFNKTILWVIGLVLLAFIIYLFVAK